VAVLGRVDYKWRASLVVALGLFLSVLDSTIVAVALPAMRHDFSTDFNTITWVVSAYLLAQAAIVPVTGYVTDRAGTKRVFVVATAVFVLGSVLCALAPTKEMLIAARVVQGLGGGALFPTSFAIAYRAFPRDEWGRATAIIGVPVLLAPSLGPVIGGYLTTAFSWRAIFVINLPLGLLALGLGAALLQGRDRLEGIEGGAARFDAAGLALAVLAFTILVYGLTEAGINGWGNPVVIGALILAGVLLAILCVVELRSRYPVLDVRVFRYATFSRAIVLIWLAAAFYYGSLFLIPFFFERVEGLSAVTAGEIMVSQGLAAAVGIAVGGELYGKLGPRTLAVTGMLALAVSTIGFTRLSVTTTGLSLQIWLILRGLGLGLTTTPLQNLALSVVDRRDLARGTSLVNVTRQVSTAAGVAALAAYVAQQAASHGAAAAASLRHGTPSAMVAACSAHPGIAACIQRHAIAMGLNDAFSVGLVACSLAVLLALVVGRDPSLEALRSNAPEVVSGAFPSLSRDVMVEAAGRAQAQSYDTGHVIVRQGDRGGDVYIIASGDVRVTRRSDAGVETELRRLGAGQYFGEIGLLANSPRTATVTAISAVDLLVLNEATFRDLVGRSEETAADIRRVMAERLAVLP